MNRHGECLNVRYSGPIDFVIGSSRPILDTIEDASVIVTRMKKGFYYVEAKVVAQAVALLNFRRGATHPRGVNGSGGHIVFICTDGERWIFSKLTCDREVLQSTEFNVNICENNMEESALGDIFNWIRYAITVGLVSLFPP